MADHSIEIEAANQKIRDAMRSEQEAFLAWCAAKDVRRKLEEDRCKLLLEIQKAASFAAYTALAAKQPFADDVIPSSSNEHPGAGQGDPSDEALRGR